MKPPRNLIAVIAAGSLVAVSAHADLTYTFATDAEGFQGVTWQSASPTGWADLPAVKQNHTAGGWQMVMTKEFAWAEGGGSANQQLEMQALANGNSRISFDVMADGSSFPAAAANWFQFNIAGNSDGSAGWTQLGNIFTVSGWHNADDPALLSMHLDYSFAQLGWQPGDTWFQLHTGANSDAAFTVNFFLDNVTLYAVPEPTVLSLIALGAGMFLARRKLV